MRHDSRHYHRQRAELVRDLRAKGIRDERVLAAIAAVSRERFMDAALRRRAYWDEALPIGLNQTISQPFTVAYQTALLAPNHDECVLEIGTGSGYQAAVLCEMGVRVFTIERHRQLHLRAKAILEELGYRAVARYGDGTLGWEGCAPYDGIIVTAGAADVPEALLKQLRRPEGERPGGRLVIPVGGGSEQVMMRITCLAEGEYEYERGHVFRFVPLVSN